MRVQPVNTSLPLPQHGHVYGESAGAALHLHRHLPTLANEAESMFSSALDENALDCYNSNEAPAKPESPSVSCKQRLPYTGSISSLQACHFHKAKNLVAIGGESTVSVCQISPSSTDSLISLETIASDIHSQPFINSLCWRPDSTESKFGFAFCSPDLSVVLYSGSTEEGSTTLSARSYPMHDGQINSCSLTTTSIFATSDDCTVQEADIERKTSRSLFLLNSPGVAVQWKMQHPDLLLVAELNGKMHLLDTRHRHNDTGIYSFQSPTVDADIQFPYIVAISGPVWTLWDARNTASPVRRESSRVARFEKIRFCSASTTMFATSSGSSLKVWDINAAGCRTEQQASAITGLSWLANETVCLTGADRAVHCWPVTSTKARSSSMSSAELYPSHMFDSVPDAAEATYPAVVAPTSSQRAAY